MDKPKPLVFDGMNMPPLRPLRENAEKRFTEIRDLECMKDDIILATYSKSGIIILALYDTILNHLRDPYFEFSWNVRLL